MNKPTPAQGLETPEMLSADRLAEIAASNAAREFMGVPTISETVQAFGDILDLLAHAAALTTRLQQAEAAAARMKEEHKKEVLDILRDMRLPVMDATLFAHVPEEYQRGVNTERLAINTYCRQKAYEYSPEGIGPDPELPGQWDTLPAAPPVAPEAGKQEAAHPDKPWERWFPVANSTPENDQTVMVRAGAGQPKQAAYYRKESGRWYDTAGKPLENLSEWRYVAGK